MLKQRILTASILIPVFVGLLYLAPSNWVSGVFLVILIAGGWEWGRLLGFPAYLNALYLLAMTAACFWSTHLSTQIFILACAFWLLAAGMLLVLHVSEAGLDILKGLSTEQPVVWKILGASLGWLVLIPAWLALKHIGDHDRGADWILALFILVWTADISAYFAGKAWGYHKLSVRLSPGKSIEGVLGGVLAVIAAGGMMGAFWLPVGSHWLDLVILSALLSVISVVGDLFQSVIKRVSGVKDSGHILPGHGGVLDRIDSLTAAAPFFLIGINLILDKS
ncbi:MAG: phosphatidate cytidylyltransferase [Gammaproteobacteria bacterium]|nr:MAG: phosphatidate cytidylyltransferase [Gammaproteobacteria bacterium]